MNTPLGRSRIMQMSALAALGMLGVGAAERRVVNDIASKAKAQRVDFKTATRRAVGTADRQHDPERVAAAEAKRARKRQRNRYHANGLLPPLRGVTCGECFGDYRNPKCKACGGTGMIYV